MEVQKQIIVTCNYEARRRGLYKLQLIREAKQKCPDVIIVLGEDLTRFRNASKDNYDFLRSYTWSNKVERLGFDEVFMDVTDMIDYNIDLLNLHDLTASFFHLDRNDPTIGFAFDASNVLGHTFPKIPSRHNHTSIQDKSTSHVDPIGLLLRLKLGSHLAQHLRHHLEEQKGYSSTVGISTNKMLSKLVGNVNKPKGQTTLVPPYMPNIDPPSNVSRFIDDHDIGKIPGIGFKTSQKIRESVLNRPAAFSAGLVYGGTKENVKVKDVRTLDGMGPEFLGQLLAGPGVPQDLGEKVWGLINGIDHTEVAKAKEVPKQISIEDSYIRLDELDQVRKEFLMLAKSLLKRMRLDLTSLTEDDEPVNGDNESNREASVPSRKWIALPRTLRLSTRPRPPLNPDGSRPRLFNRISKSGSMPSFVSNLTLSIDTLAEKLMEESLMPLFRKLHPEKSGWNLSLVNICATNMSLTANSGGKGAGRDIGKMFSRQEDALREWKVDDVDVAPSDRSDEEPGSDGDDQKRRDAVTTTQEEHRAIGGSEDLRSLTQDTFANDDNWDSDEGTQDAGETCKVCGAMMPSYALAAHERFHTLPD
ncbi:hypothetical protein ACLMJK_005372 [Lecanora helva]